MATIEKILEIMKEEGLSDFTTTKDLGGYLMTISIEKFEDEEVD